MLKKRQAFFRKTVSIFTSLFLVVQSLMPGFFVSPKTFAQDAVVEAPAPTVVPTPDQQQNIEQITPTPIEEISPTVDPTPTIEPSVAVTPEPTEEVTPTIEPSVATPTETPSDPPNENGPPQNEGQNVTPVESPTPTETPTIPQEPTPEVIEQTCEQPKTTRTTSDYDWSVNEFAGTAETRNPVDLGVTYVFPKNTNVSVTFTCLPKDTSKRTALKIQEIPISELKLPDGINSTTNYAYDITTGMQDGTFKYTVTLPTSDKKNVGVSYIEKSVEETKNTSLTHDDIKEIEQNIGSDGDKIKASEIDHFTIFIATYSDSTFSIEKSSYARGETVYIKAGDLDNSKYYRLTINPPGYSNTQYITNCQKGNVSSITGTYILSSTAEISSDWKAELKRYDSKQECEDQYAYNYEHEDKEDAFSVTAAPRPTPVVNPSLPASCCGLDIALVIDNSNSINETELGQMKTALKEFVTALAGTPTQFSVTRFGTNASVIQGFTSNTSLVTTAIDSVTTGGGGTDWQKGIIAARGSFDPRTDKPNLMIFASDGNPTFPDCGGSNTCNADVDHAVDEANIAKTSPLNIRILALGIGGELSADNLKAISGTVVNGSDITTTDVITTDFSGMAAKLAAFAAKTCGGKISINKYIDNVQTAGGKTWSFTIDGTTTLTTDANGQVASGTLTAGNHSVSEVSIPAGYSFDTANCTNGTLDKPNNAVKNITVTNDSIITCNFYNTANYTPTKICHATGALNKWVEETPATLGQLQGHVGSSHQSGNDIIPAIPVFLPLGQNWDTTGQAIWNNGCAIPPAKGTLIVKKTVINNDGGTKGATDFSFQLNGAAAIPFEADGQNDISVNPGTYSVTEVPVTGYDISYSDCSNIKINAGETKTCIITNNDIAPKITVTKIVSGSLEPVSNFPLFVANAINTYPINSGQQYSINAGSWVVSETNKAGYTATITGDCATNGAITLLPGDVKSCTITNKRDTGVVTFQKLVDDGSSVFGWLFTVKDANGATIGTYHSGDTATLPTGSYTVTETGGSHYAFQSTSGICTTSPTNGVTSMTVTKTGGTCTFNNVYVPYCGDGMKNQPSEQCDDGNTVNTDTCTNACMNATCGDGFIKTGVEECDNGADNDSSCTPPYGGSCNYCDAATCKPITITGPYCGDGIVNNTNGEQCDDHNTTSGDGCSTTCQEEPGSITFIKDANPNDPQSFHFTYGTNVYPIGDFDLTDDGNGDSSEQATFSSIPAGTYAWTENAVEGWDITSISCQETKTSNSTVNANLGRATIVLDPGEHVTCTFTNTKQIYPLFVTKFEDVNGNAVQNTGEPALDGWTMELYDNATCSGNPLATKLTDSTAMPGTAVFRDLYFGKTYWVKEIEQTPAWVNTTGNCVAATIHDDLHANNTVTFGNFMYGTLTGHKFEDTDNNHAFTAGEPYLPEWNMRIYKSNNDGSWNSIGTAMTKTDGMYMVEGLSLGTYKVCELAQSGWQETYPDDGATRENSDEALYCHQFTITQSGQNIQKDFGNIHTGDLIVTKFEDTNGNGTWDKDTEPALNGWEINVAGQKSQLTGSGDNNKGEAAFNRLTDGTYYLSETQQEGWKQTGMYCENSGPGTTITKEGEAYGHHGACSGWNGCGDAKTCAQWACEINGYTTLVSYGDDKPCTQFNNCHLFYSRGSIQWNWGNWCEVQGVTDIVCTGRSTTMQQSASSVASAEQHSSILPVEKVYAEDTPSGYPATVTAGGKTKCYVGNQYIPAKLEVSKENNAMTSLLPGSSVLYTLTVTSRDNTSYGVTLTDLLPKGFVYRAGSWTANSSTHGLLSLGEPSYHSPGTWDIGTIEKDEVITLTLTADIANDEKPGTYKDLALAYGCQRNDTCELDDANSIIASAVDPGQLDDTFVGTEVTIVKDQQDSKTLAVNHEVTEEGTVLGATTDLPATGANAGWIILAISFIITGIGAIAISTKLRRYHA